MEVTVFLLLGFKSLKLKNYILSVEFISEMASRDPEDL